MRSMWKGSLSFGLVNIPIQMYTGSREKQLSFTLLHKKDMSLIRYARICQQEGKEVPWNEIVKGYELEKGNFVVVDDKDFEKASPKKSQVIEIVSFVNSDDIDPIYYVKPYFLEPDKNAASVYGLLREALKKSRKVGIARFVWHNHEQLAVIKVYGNMLILNELRYEDELVKPEHLKIPSAAKINAKELDVAIKLIDHLTTDFKPATFKDTYAEEMKRIIKQKAKGRLVQPKEEKTESPKVHDIMSLLQASLDDENKKKPRKKPRKSA